MFVELDNSIVGFSSIWALNVIGREAKKVKPNGWIVELGSYCGRSAFVLGKNKHPSVKLTCVDNWPGPPTPVPIEDYVYGNVNTSFNYSEFLNNTAEIENLETLRCMLPLNMSYLGFSKKIDLLFVDLYPDHDLYINQLSYWHRFMAQGSTIIVNDIASNTSSIEGFCRMVDLSFIDDNNLAIIRVP
jgi:hypothetical protein